MRQTHFSATHRSVSLGDLDCKAELGRKKGDYFVGVDISTDLEFFTKRLGAKMGNIIEVGGGVDWEESGDLKWEAEIKLNFPIR